MVKSLFMPACRIPPLSVGAYGEKGMQQSPIPALFPLRDPPFFIPPSTVLKEEEERDRPRGEGRGGRRRSIMDRCVYNIRLKEEEEEDGNRPILEHLHNK